jgi:RND family efflux transporter MFP subunit
MSSESTSRPQPESREEWRSKPAFAGRRGGATGWLVGGLATIGVVIASFFGVKTYVGQSGESATGKAKTYVVQKGSLIVTITEDGNLESAANKDVKCEVAGGSTILWIVKDGTMVKAGDKLVELDSSALEDQVSQQKITFEKAQATKIQALKEFETAKISLKEYTEGTFLKDLQAADAQIKIAMENLRTAENTLAYTQKMFRKGYVSKLEVEAKEFAVARSQLDLDTANTTKMVLEEFTKPKTVEDLQSKVDTAEAKMRSEEAACALEESKLKRLEAQVQKCVITAPQDGMVIYANEQGMRGMQQQSTIEEGAAVRERQTIIRLPDLAQMQCKVLVHESKVETLRPGMRGRIKIGERQLQGTIATVSSQPEQGNWWSPNVKQYGTIVKIDGEQNGLRPGMTASVEILIADLPDVLSVPVAAVVEKGAKYYCWVRKPGIEAGGAPEKRELVLGMSNTIDIEVKDGLAEGDVVILNPRAIVEDARRDDPSDAAPPTNTDEAFGPGASDAARARQQSGPQGGGSPAGGPPAGPNGGAPAVDGSPSDAAGGEGGGRRGPGEGGGPGGGPGGGRRMDLMQHDKDGDKKVTKEEAPEYMQRFFDMMDTNADGAIDQAEITEARNRMRQAQGEGGFGPPGGGGFGGPPGGS